MKNQSAREYLESIYWQEKKIQEKKDKLERMKSDAASLKGLSYDSPHVQSNSEKDWLSVRVPEYVDFEQKIIDDIFKLYEKRRAVLLQIESLPDEKYISLLYKRYLQYKGLEQIAQEMDYTYEYIRRLHGKALNEFEKNCMEV